MKMRIGNQTAFAAASPLEPFEFALDHSFGAFEFFPDRGPEGDSGWDERSMSLDEREYIRRAAEVCDITLTVHAPLTFDPLNAPTDARVFSTIEFAQDIGAVLLTLHLDLRRGPEAFCEALAPTLEAAQEANLRLALENTVWTGPEDFNAFFTCLDLNHSALSKHVGMCFDLGHANVCQATHNNYWGFLDRLAPTVPIIHLHLHENYGDRDSHLPLFTGPSKEDPAGILGLLERLEVHRFSGCGILEQWPQPPSLLADARDRLRLLMNAAG